MKMDIKFTVTFVLLTVNFPSSIHTLELYRSYWSLYLLASKCSLKIIHAHYKMYFNKTIREQFTLQFSAPLNPLGKQPGCLQLWLINISQCNPNVNEVGMLIITVIDNNLGRKTTNVWPSHESKHKTYVIIVLQLNSSQSPLNSTLWKL